MFSTVPQMSVMKLLYNASPPPSYFNGLNSFQKGNTKEVKNGFLNIDMKSLFTDPSFDCY